MEKDIINYISPSYRAQLMEIHEHSKWGTGGGGWVQELIQAWDIFEVKTILDYGCGKGRLKYALEAEIPVQVFEYDPGLPEKSYIPISNPDLVVCTDVMEHVEQDRIDNVLQHIFNLAQKAALIHIACAPAKQILPDGRNAHISIFPPEWWLAKIKSLPWQDIEISQQNHRKLTVWTIK